MAGWMTFLVLSELKSVLSLKQQSGMSLERKFFSFWMDIAHTRVQKSANLQRKMTSKLLSFPLIQLTNYSHLMLGCLDLSHMLGLHIAMKLLRILGRKSHSRTLLMNIWLFRSFLSSQK
jgi:hypothetical protein